MSDETGPTGGTIFDKYFPTIAAVLLTLYLAVAASTLLAWGFTGVLVIIFNGLVIALSIGLQLEAVYRNPDRYPEVMRYVR